MTHDEIDQLEAGPEFDALMATEVMGWKRIRPYTPNFQTMGRSGERIYPWCGAWLLPDKTHQIEFAPSTDIAATRQVWKQMHSRGWTWFNLECMRGKTWDAVFERLERIGEIAGRTWTQPTEMVATCKAALHAILEYDAKT